MCASAALLALLTSPARADAIRLHDQAAVAGPEVRLRDVAELDGPVALGLADTVVARLGDGAGAGATFAMRDLEKLLAAKNVNLGKLTVRGYGQCRIARLGATPAAAPAGGKAAGPAATQPAGAALANPTEEVSVATALTLRDRVIELLEKLAGVPRTELRITFADPDAPALAGSALEDRFEIEPQTTVVPGRVPVTVRRYRGDAVAQTLRITADVARRYLAVVSRAYISKGQTFAPGDVEMREVYVEHAQMQPLTDLRSVVGQTAAGPLKPGAVVVIGNVQSPVLVRRGDLMTVYCLAGGLVVRTVARAGADGALDQVIAAHGERSRDTFQVRVTGPRLATVVTEADGPKPKAQPAKPNTPSQEGVGRP